MNAAHRGCPLCDGTGSMNDGTYCPGVVTSARMAQASADLDASTNKLRETALRIKAERDDLLSALRVMVDTFGDEPASCLECDEGTDGPTGLNPDGSDCALCGPWRKALAVAEASIAKTSPA